MNYIDVHDKVVNLVAYQLNLDEMNITCDSKWIDDLGSDSLDSVELIMELEEEFGIEISDKEAESGIVTVGHMVDFVCGKVGVDK